MYNFLYRIFGSLTLKCEGGFTGNFLELCRRSGVAFRNARCKENILYIEITPAEIYIVRHVARETGMRVKILSRSGAVFFLKRYRKRYGMAVGFLLFTAILFHLSGFVWNVEILGESKYGNGEILSALKQNGIAVGKPLKGIDTADAKNGILLNLSNLKRLAISIDSTTVTVEIADKAAEDTLPDGGTVEPANIVADCDAYIISVSPFAGEALVKPNETVCKGQILVSGIYEDSVGRSYLTEASAEIIGQTNRQIELNVSPFNEKEELTGREKQKTSLFFYGLSVNFFTKGGNRYTKCDIITENIQPKFFNKSLPIILTKTTERELAVEKRLLSDRELEEKIEEALKKYESENLHGEIVSREVTVEIAEENCIVKATYVCNESIGVREKIILNGE